VQALEVGRKAPEGRRRRLFLCDAVTKFFKDVEGEFRVESMSPEAFVSLAKQLDVEVLEEVGVEFRGLAEALGARPRRGERYRPGDLVAAVGERVLVLVPT